MSATDSVAPARARNNLARFLMATVFTGIGALHFTSPEGFEAIIPDAVPGKRTWVYVTGVMELAAAAMLWFKPSRKAGWLVVGLLLLIFPANINQAINGIQIPGLPPAPRWALFFRLPFQALMIWAVLAGTRPAPAAPPKLEPET